MRPQQPRLLGGLVGLAATRTLDLTLPPFATKRARWIDKVSWNACQAFASRAREIDAQLIRYESARDEQGGINVALLDPGPLRPVSLLAHARARGAGSDSPRG